MKDIVIRFISTPHCCPSLTFISSPHRWWEAWSFAMHNAASIIVLSKGWVLLLVFGKAAAPHLPMSFKLALAPLTPTFALYELKRLIQTLTLLGRQNCLKNNHVCKS